MRRREALLALLAASPLRAGDYHLEEVAPGVWAAGFAAEFGSTNCAFLRLGDETLLLDVPRGVDVKTFLKTAEEASGKPVRSFWLTLFVPQDNRITGQLREAGVKQLESIPAPLVSAGGTALYLPGQKVLFGGQEVINGPRADMGGRNTAEWLETLANLEKLDIRTVVPGAGSWGGPHMISRKRRFLAEFRRQVAHGVAMGMPLKKIQAKLYLPATDYVWMPYDEPVAGDVEHIYAELTAPIAPYRGKPPVRGTAKPHALVLIGDKPHEPGHLEDGLRPVFAATGVTPHFAFDVQTLTAANLAAVDLFVILRDGYLWPNGDPSEHKVWMTPAQEKAVVDYVEGGGAFLNLHNSMGLYPDNGPYLNLVGGRYIGHGPLERFRVDVADADHPITKGVKGFFAADEQHTPPYDEKKAHLLLRNRSDDGKTAAAGWCYEPGKGRLVHLASGHTRDALEHPMYQLLMRNSVNWLLRR